ncbi:MAG: AbrB/MazE/SpoVT family DNA-binding domain-containing protein [Candidatus Nanoarchaeia archaeon]|nr:AbrB/MazE/SpoVT family DNA-binding domain-containing protein [Candidatus Nanoarchaeia archaeon]
MIRKVAQIGPATLMVSLPSKWAKKLGIKKGDEIDVVEEGNTIKVSTTKVGYQKGEINLETDQKFLKLFLNRMYRLGYDEVKINFTKKVDTKLISKEDLKYLLGFEIVSTSDKTCFIKNVTETQQREFDSLFNRLFLMVHSLAREGYEYLEDKGITNLDNFTAIEDTINKLYNLCERILNKYGHQNQSRTNLLLQQNIMLEQIADAYYNLYELILENKIKLNKETIKLLRDVEQYFMEIYSLFNKFKQDSLSKLYNKRKHLIKQLKEQISSGKGKEFIAFSQINVILKLIRELEVSIIGF